MTEYNEYITASEYDEIMRSYAVNQIEEQCETALPQPDNAVTQISVVKLIVDKNYPWKLQEESEEYQGILDSISEIGIITPLIVVPAEDDKYRIVSGRRRYKIAEDIGIVDVPCIVLQINDEYLIQKIRNDSNLKTRQHNLPSELAKAYKLELDSYSRQGKRNDLIDEVTSAPAGPKLLNVRSNEIVASKYGESIAQIKRYIRLNKLIPDLLNLVDTNKMSLRTAADYVVRLTSENQVFLFSCWQKVGRKIKQDRVVAVLRAQDKAKKEERILTEEEVFEAYMNILPDKENTNADQIQIPVKKIEKFFPPWCKRDVDRINFLMDALNYYSLSISED
ncbi:MAG: ParB/RepB/Spo0J family partition protein [Saccharofermentans sp.]|nr:ParB/RepB/Spo0J family partition protein [Saccharofermentans sp.]